MAEVGPGRAHAIDQTIDGSSIVFGYAATGTDEDGTAFGTAESRCDDWTNGSSGNLVSGIATAADDRWSTGSARPCYTLHRIYCFEQ
ncbi:MAG: hypothetical protein JRH11_24150 [Deltaproteobacteria bacterium]|nr:hypothetical protein [Deltaproteobacteria bacterium]